MGRWPAWLARFEHTVGSEKQQRLSATATTTDVSYLEKLDMTSSSLAYMKELSTSCAPEDVPKEEKAFSSFADAPVDLSGTTRPAVVAMEAKTIDRTTYVQQMHRRTKASAPDVAVEPSPPPQAEEEEEEEFDYFGAMQASLPADMSELGYSKVRARDRAESDYLSHVPGKENYLSWPPSTPPPDESSSLWPVKTDSGGSLASSLKVDTETRYRGSSLADLNITALSVATLRAAIARNDYVTSIESSSQQPSADYLSSIERIKSEKRRPETPAAAAEDYLAGIRVDAPPPAKRSSGGELKASKEDEYVPPSGYEYLLKLDSRVQSTGAAALTPPSLPQALESVKLPKTYFDTSSSLEEENSPPPTTGSYLSSIDSSSYDVTGEDFSISSNSGKDQSFKVKKDSDYLSNIGKSTGKTRDYLSLMADSLGIPKMAESLRQPAEQLKQDVSRSIAENAEKTQTTIGRYASEVASLSSTLLAASRDKIDHMSSKGAPLAGGGKEYLSTIGTDKAKNADYSIAGSTKMKSREDGYLSTLPKNTRSGNLLRSAARAGDTMQSFVLKRPARAVRETFGKVQRPPMFVHKKKPEEDASSTFSTSKEIPRTVSPPPPSETTSSPSIEKSQQLTPPPSPSSTEDYLAFVPSGASTTRSRRDDSKTSRGDDYLSYIDSTTTPGAYVQPPLSYVVSESNGPSEYLQSSADGASTATAAKERGSSSPDVWRHLRDTLDHPLLGRIGVVGVALTSFGFNLASALFTLAVAFDPEERRQRQASNTLNPAPV